MHQTKPPPKFRLRTTLVVPFVLQILTAVGLVGFIAYRSGQQAVNDVASQLRIELTDRITEKLASYTGIPKTINRLNASAFAQGDIDVSGTRGEYQFWQQMQIYQNISYVYCADEQGGFFGVGRLSDKDRSKVVLQFSNPATSFITLEYGFDGRGNRTAQIGTFEEPYDPRVRPWYIAARTERVATWSEIYLDFTTNLPTVTASVPVYSRANGAFIGVCATDFFLPQEISRFLQSLRIGKTGTAFIVERSGHLVATSSDEPMLKGTGEQSERLLASASTDPTIRATAEALDNSFENLREIESIQKMDFQLNNQKQYVQIVPFQDNNLDWLVILTIPEADFMERIHASRRDALWLSLAALGLAIALGIFTARWITRPILQMSQASDKLAQGDLDQQVSSSSIAEIDTLSNSFNTMSGQLKESFKALETKNEELRITEENYRSIFENALEGIFQSSPEGRYININPALAKIYGYSSPQEMMTSITNIGEQIYVDRERRDEFRELLEKQGNTKDFEYRCYCKNGSIIWVQIDARVVKDSNGNVIYYEGIVQDITERKRREDELRRQLEELKIEIDDQKREQEVTMLTESSYFQEVQQEVAEVDLDEFWS